MCAGPPLDDFLTDALPERHDWTGRPTREDLKPLPGSPAVYLLLNAESQPIQLATTQALRRLLTGRLTDETRAEQGKADIAAIARTVRYRPTGTPFESRWWYYRLARALYPREYRRLISFRPAHFLHVDWLQPIPELRVTERVWCLSGEFVGPWPSHKSCQMALEGLWDLFDLCRYPEQVRKTPHGARCAYAEMGRCDAPCDGSAPLDAYRERSQKAWQFATGGVASWISEATARMQQAAREQAFEQAGQLKQQLAFANRWQQEWSPHVRRADDMNELMLLPVTRRKAWRPFVFRNGHLAEGPIVPERKLAAEVAKWLSAQLASSPSGLEAVVRMEQTWLYAHLLFSRESAAAIRIPLSRLAQPEPRHAEIAAALQARNSANNEGPDKPANP